MRVACKLGGIYTVQLLKIFDFGLSVPAGSSTSYGTALAHIASATLVLRLTRYDTALACIASATHRFQRKCILQCNTWAPTKNAHRTSATLSCMRCRVGLAEGCMRTTNRHSQCKPHLRCSTWPPCSRCRRIVGASSGTTQSARASRAQSGKASGAPVWVQATGNPWLVHLYGSESL